MDALTALGLAGLGLAGFALLAGLAFGLTAFFLALALARPRMYRPEETRRSVIENDETSPGVLERFREAFTVASPQGYSLHGVVLPGDDPETGRPAERTIILCHGHTWAWHGMLKYLGPFLDKGWNIVLYDSRGHGANQRLPVTFGRFEIEDLQAVIAWARARFPRTSSLGLFGESMGAAIILQAMGMGVDADFTICDCAFSDLGDLCRNELRRIHFPRFLSGPMYDLSRALVRRMAGFDVEAVSPRRSVRSRRIPLLIMHGALDSLAPVWMAREILEAAETAPASAGPCRLEIFPEARHANSWASAPAAYDRAVETFLRDVLYPKA